MERWKGWIIRKEGCVKPSRWKSSWRLDKVSNLSIAVCMWVSNNCFTVGTRVKNNSKALWTCCRPCTVINDSVNEFINNLTSDIRSNYHRPHPTTQATEFLAFSQKYRHMLKLTRLILAACFLMTHTHTHSHGRYQSHMHTFITLSSVKVIALHMKMHTYIRVMNVFLIYVLQTPPIPFPPKNTPPVTLPNTLTQGARTPNRMKYLTSKVRHTLYHLRHL